MMFGYDFVALWDCSGTKNADGPRKDAIHPTRHVRYLPSKYLRLTQNTFFMSAIRVKVALFDMKSIVNGLTTVAYLRSSSAILLNEINIF